jgi:uncharacterized membrane protein YeaQ/YmgE (transglycosylase-associated protein family)
LSLLVFLISLVLTGLIVGALARLALPGPDPMGIGQTILVGIAGAFIGGLIADAFLATSARGWAIPISVLVSTGIVYAIRRSRGGTLTDPGLGRRRLPR